MGRRAKPTKVKTDAKRPLARESPKNEGSRVRDLEKRLAESLEREKATGEILQEKDRALTEALEQQTAASEILRVISSSRTDVQPVFDMIAERAMRLCDADLCLVQRSDGKQLHLAAIHGADPASVEVARSSFPMPVSTESCAGRAVRHRGTVHLADVLDDPTYELKQQARAMGFRGGLAVPMLRDEHVIGAIYVGRATPGLFSPTQIGLLQTFADQAVIAIENARLFKELQEKNRALTTAHEEVTEALEQQTATSEILRVISSSPMNVQPVFDAIANSAFTLCAAKFVVVFTLQNGMLEIAAMNNISPAGIEALHRAYPMPVGTTGAASRAALTGQVVNIPDVFKESDYGLRSVAQVIGLRSITGVPMIRDGQVIGVITVPRAETGGLSDTQIKLLQTFADQAVIAVENVRLFTELQASNRELTTALDTQTATSDILRVISRSQTDVLPVFDAILGSAVRLLRGYSGVLTRIAGDQIELAALTSTDDAGDAATRALFPQSLQSQGAYAQAMRDRAPLNIADAHTDPRLSEARHAYARVRGYRSWAVVPLLRPDEAVGTISVTRREPGGFTDDEIALLKTFADQAVIAIENARLLTELQARTEELTRSVGELRALGEVGQAISSTLDLQTVLSTIVGRATELSGTDAGVIYEYDEPREVFVPRATAHLEADIVETMLATPVRKGEGATGRLAGVQEPIQVPDILAAPADSRVRGALVRAGYRALLAVPLLREDRLLGGLTVIRKATGEFGPAVIELLRTFATQSALAIQNARLFREIADKSHQLEMASQHKSEFLANMSHELRTPLNAIIGFSEVLSERMFGDLNAKQEEYLKDIHASGQHLLSLINDILDLSKIEAGRMELELTDFNLPATLDNALTLVRERAGRRGIALHLTVDEQLDQVRADERKVRQVVLNLLSNAIKFTPEGGRIEVRAKPVNGSIEVSVSDTGVGIAPEDQEAIFEEFKQVGTADKKVEGTGLGLALSRKFIELHGGKIWVTSQVGKGSTFTFTIPVRGEQSGRGGASYTTLNS